MDFDEALDKMFESEPDYKIDEYLGKICDEIEKGNMKIDFRDKFFSKAINEYVPKWKNMNGNICVYYVYDDETFVYFPFVSIEKFYENYFESGAAVIDFNDTVIDSGNNKILQRWKTEDNALFILDDITLEYEVAAYYLSWGSERNRFLKENFPDIYLKKKKDNTLFFHLYEIGKIGFELQIELTDKIAKDEGVDGELKKSDMMEWVGRMNNIKNRVEEVIRNKIIYTEIYENN